MTKIDYAALNDELDQILARLQSGDVDIDEAMKLYERGAVITKELQKYLKTAENNVVKLKATFKD